MIDVDTFVGLWLRDIPYIWLQNKKAKSKTILSGYTRKYLLPTFMYYHFSQSLKMKGTPLDSKLTLKLSTNCGIEQRRMFMIYGNGNVDGFGMKKHRNVPYEIRVNGRKVYIPAYLTTSSNTTIHNVYDILGLRLPSGEQISNWQKDMLVHLDVPQPPPLFKRIVLPGLFETFGKRYHIQKDASTLYGKWLNYILDSKATDHDVCMFRTSKKGYASFALEVDVSNAGHEFIHFTPMLGGIKTCRGSKKILIPVLWRSKENPSIQRMTLIIIDGITAFAFDPWGDKFYGPMNKNLDLFQMLGKLGLNRGQIEIIMGHPGLFPSLSFLTLETMKDGSILFPDEYEEGLSVIWVLWFIETILLNENVPIENLPRLAIQQMLADGETFKSTVLGYEARMAAIQTSPSFVIKNRSITFRRRYILPF